MTQIQNSTSSYVIGDMISTDPDFLLDKQTNATGWIRFTHSPRSKSRPFIFLGDDPVHHCTLWVPVTSSKDKDSFNKTTHFKELDRSKMPGLTGDSCINKQEVWAIPNKLFAKYPPTPITPSADKNYVQNVVIPWCQNAIDRLTK